MKTHNEDLPAEMQRSLNGTPVLMEDTFNYSTARVGDYVERGGVPNTLPERCYSTLLDTGKVVILKRGETGYYKTDIPFTSREEAKALADEYNRRLGITKAQAAAMSAGSMFGFHVPAANPANYDENGQPIKPTRRR